MLALLFLFIITLASVGANILKDARHQAERKRWDEEKSRYVATALIAVQTGSGAAAASVVKAGTDRPVPKPEVFQQLDA